MASFDYEQYQAGVEMWTETGSLIARPAGPLIARPPRVASVTILPAVVLWVPVAPVAGFMVGVDPGQGALTYLSTPDDLVRHVRVRDDAGEERPYEPPVDWGRFIEEQVEMLAGVYDLPAPDVGAIPERYVSSGIRWSESFVAVERLIEAIFGRDDRVVPNLEQHTPADEDLIDTLLDLARAGDEAGFRDLARMRGVPVAELDTMWAGTRRRVGKP